jgi:hypothetical protein
LIKNYNFPIPRPPYRMSKLQKKPSALKREHPALHNMKLKKKFYFSGSFLPSRSGFGFGSGFQIRIRISNTDPDQHLIDIRIQSGSGSETLQYTYYATFFIRGRSPFAGPRGSTGLWARWRVGAAAVSPRRMLTSCRLRPTMRRGTGAARCSTRPNPRLGRGGRARRFR